MRSQSHGGSAIRVIAEIGINHDGSEDTARRLIQAIAPSVWGVKFQYRNLERAYAAGASEIGDEMLHREIRRNYLAPEVIGKLVEFGHARGLAVGVSVFDAGDLDDFGAALPSFDFFKTPSVELTNSGLVDRMVESGKPTFISTGCHDEPAIEAALSRLSADADWTPMHCISNYPVMLQNARLGYISHMRRRWDRTIGYSSHDEQWMVCLLAMQLGARVIERHVTYDRAARGLDHSTSSTPEEFAAMAQFAENFDALMAGDGARFPNQGELLNLQNLGRSCYAAAPIAKGDPVTADKLTLRSPRIGVSAGDMEPLIGRPAQRDVARGEAINATVFEPLAQTPDDVLAFARRMRLSLPVRFHDLGDIAQRFPIGCYEFHLSFAEIQSAFDLNTIPAEHRYSIHLPDYVSATELMDPFSPSESQRAASLDILDRTAALAKALQDKTGEPVPVVGSFSVVHATREEFFAGYADLFSRYGEGGVTILPQWLPPIAWYFGGSVRLNAMIDTRDAELLDAHGMGLCMDVCHLFMGANLFGFSAADMMARLKPNIRHLHIADAAGIDGEGLAIGEGDPANRPVLRSSLDFDCMKVVEVWQGHLDDGAGFAKALVALKDLYDGDA